MTPPESAQAKELARKILLHMDIDLMNIWIAEGNAIRSMLKCAGIEPRYPEMKLLNYPSDAS